MLRSEPSFSVYSDPVDGVREEHVLAAKKEALERIDSCEFSFGKRTDMVLIKEEEEEEEEVVEEEEEEEEEKGEEENGKEEGKRGGFVGNENIGLEGDVGDEKGFNGIRKLGSKKEVEDGGKEGFKQNGKIGFGEEEERKEGLGGNEDLALEEDDECEKGFNGIRTLRFKEEAEGGRKESFIGEEGLDGVDRLVIEEVESPASPPMYLAGGLGSDGYDITCNGVGLDLPGFDGETGDIQEYYTRMLDEYPLHPLLLQNYAQFLEFKGDLHGAEEYYHRCTLVEPDDGHILASYAKLVWRLHHDQTKASHYFERAARAAPQDSDVLAAYASFMWEVDDGDDGDDGEAGSQETEQVESNEDPKGAEEHHSHATAADPEDGETLCRYARLLWDVHHDPDRALSYFEKAVQVAPEDSHVLAAYARFLWETEEDDEEEDGARQDQIGVSEAAVPSDRVQVVSEAL